MGLPSQPLRGLRWLFVGAGTCRFRACVKHNSANASDPDSVIGRITCSEHDVRLNAPLSVLAIGALLGGLIVGALRQWAWFLRQYERGELSWRAFARELGAFAVFRLPVGLCTAALAILLARISRWLQGVLRVELNDFRGGFVVGMPAQSTSGPVAEALAS